MVPESFGCGSAVFAAIAILAPSRAARSAMASPMPRDAPVMNNVLPASDIVSLTSCSLLAREEVFERGARFGRLQPLLEMGDFGFDLRDHAVGLAAHQLARDRDGAGRQAGDFARRLQCRH